MPPSFLYSAMPANYTYRIDIEFRLIYIMRFGRIAEESRGSLSLDTHIFFCHQCVNPRRVSEPEKTFSFPSSFQLVALVDTVNDYTRIKRREGFKKKESGRIFDLSWINTFFQMSSGHQGLPTFLSFCFSIFTSGLSFLLPLWKPFPCD